MFSDAIVDPSPLVRAEIALARKSVQAGDAALDDAVVVLLEQVPDCDLTDMDRVTLSVSSEHDVVGRTFAQSWYGLAIVNVLIV
ncbi:hypothetical protein [Cyanobium sp. CH-040]|uniref:hypothetical protein n=1 Tax=Cyanobium sp. CH-040 TaxID=2823708 RepID=UPI0020CEC22F|nr:hypothetical protein [Cyanobium sp. CH-040]MCP9927307.1 hypothetical protein [Cyanobium sp. CH-040]